MTIFMNFIFYPLALIKKCVSMILKKCLSTVLKKLVSQLSKNIWINSFIKTFLVTFSIHLLFWHISKNIYLDRFRHFSKNIIFIRELQKSLFHAFSIPMLYQGISKDLYFHLFQYFSKNFLSIRQRQKPSSTFSKKHSSPNFQIPIDTFSKTSLIHQCLGKNLSTIDTYEKT
jgi:hypothetical protein